MDKLEKRILQIMGTEGVDGSSDIENSWVMIFHLSLYIVIVITFWTYLFLYRGERQT